MSKLMDKLRKELSNGIPFMEGREKAEIAIGETYIIDEYGFLQGEDGDFLVFKSRDNQENFFFGGSVITEKFKTLEKVFEPNEVASLLEEGIECKFEEKKSKKNRKYISVEFI